MLTRRLLAASAAATLVQMHRNGAQAATLTLRAADGVAVEADSQPASGPMRGTVLLFHQAGTNRWEYAPIAPRLNALGFATIAIDQRSGGAAFGHRNETADRIGRDPGYLAALPDMEAAFAAAKGKILLWGSSYSAALVFVLAAQHPGAVTAVLAFSPGEYVSGVSIHDAAAKVACPIFVTSASDSSEEAAAASILAASPAAVKRQYRPRAGLHGSATLRPENTAGAEGAWNAVIAFLNEVAPA